MWQQEEFSCHILHHFGLLAGNILEIFTSAWLELVNIKRATVILVWALAVQPGLLEES
jgi:hypothetical protein